MALKLEWKGELKMVGCELGVERRLVDQEESRSPPNGSDGRPWLSIKCGREPLSTRKIG